LFDQLVADRVLSSEDLLPYLQDALEDNKTTDARKFAAYIFEPADLSAYDAMMAGPAKWLSAQTGSVSGMRAEVVAMGLARLARSDLNAAVAATQGTWSSRLPKKNLQWAYGQLGLWGMMRLDPLAIDWYKESGGVRLSVHNEAWRVRAALRQPKIDWAWVIRHIDQMTAAQKADSTWVYWKARGLAATGKKNDAQKAYASIATEYSFYGQLAAEELGKSIAVPDRPTPVTAQELAQARANPGLRRAVTLFKRGWRTDAVPEWNFTLLGMTDRELLAAAELARDVKRGKIKADAINDKVFAKYLDSPTMSDVDLFLRSSGEQRTSNFLPWQSVYAEFVFMDVLWPDVTRKTLWKAIEEYSARDRRFGKA
jgi:soluble lytic murein transglycosylase